MTTSTFLHSLVRQLRPLDRCSDAELLQRFRTDGDPDAFEILVSRYGACVLRACRKVLSSAADVEDAFQATFVVLFQSAGTIRQQQALGGWLSGVAHRVSLKALAAATRRRRLEQRQAPAAAETPDLSWREACAILHEEVDRLPDKYRLPLILRYLDGKSRDEAARQLGVRLDVVRGLLARGRERLRGRLLKRGIALSAGLLAVVAGSARAGAPSERLLRATFEAAVMGRLSASVAGLVHGAAAPVALGKFKLLTLAVLAAGLIAVGVGLAMPGARPKPVPARAYAAAPEAEPPHAPEAATVDGEALELKGRVLGPDDKPAAGAKIFLLSNKQPNREAVATADAEGRFQFVVKPKEVGSDARVLATVEGLGPDWVDLAACAKGVVTLRPRKDDVPVTGRVLTLEGQPVVGAIVEAEKLGKPADGDDDLKAWLDNNVKLRKESIWVNERGLLTVAPAAFGAKLTATTDRDGKFRLTGAGRDRVLNVRVRGDGIEHKFFRLATRPDAPKEGYIKTRDFNYGLYGPEMTIIVGPSKPLVGTVTDRATGKPIAGILVEETSHGVNTATTDDKGRYRLEGVPKTQHYYLTAAGKPGVPYFDCSQHAVTDTAGLDPITVDFALDRGVEITGRVVDKETGQPVAGHVQYFESQDNPHLDDYPSLKDLRVIISNWGRLGPDGAYTLLTIPGPGAVVVSAEAHDRYPTCNAEQDLWAIKVRSFPSAPAHAVLAVNPDENKAASLVVNVELRAGKSRKGTILGPDDKPLEGVQAAGLVPGGKPETLKSATFTLTGLGERKRILLFFHAEKKLGAVVVVRGDADEPITVKMQPLGSVEGRVLDADGKPWAGLKVKLHPQVTTRSEYDNLPDEAFAFQGGYGIRPGLWSAFIGRDAVTDADGRFKVEGVLPGVEFTLYVSDGDLAKARTLVLMRKQVGVAASKAKDLGTLKNGEGLTKE